MKFLTSCVVLTLFTVAGAGCPADYDGEPEIWLYRSTAIPITTVADVQNPSGERTRSMELSSGVAIGLACSEYCPGSTRTGCADTEVTVTPPALADIHEAFSLSGQVGTFVIVANDPGVGHVDVTSPCATARYPLNVVPRGR